MECFLKRLDFNDLNIIKPASATEANVENIPRKSSEKMGRKKVQTERARLGKFTGIPVVKHDLS